jgi:hypothetical protein
VNLFGELLGCCSQEGAERLDEVVGVSRAASVETPRRGEDHARVACSGLSPLANQAVEVLDVLGDDDAAVDSCQRQKLVVRRVAEALVVRRGNDVMTFVAESFGASSRPTGAAADQAEAALEPGAWRT